MFWNCIWKFLSLSLKPGSLEFIFTQHLTDYSVSNPSFKQQSKDRKLFPSRCEAGWKWKYKLWTSPLARTPPREKHTWCVLGEQKVLETDLYFWSPKSAPKTLFFSRNAILHDCCLKNNSIPWLLVDVLSHFIYYQPHKPSLAEPHF